MSLPQGARGPERPGSLELVCSPFQRQLWTRPGLLPAPASTYKPCDFGQVSLMWNQRPSRGREAGGREWPESSQRRPARRSVPLGRPPVAAAAV